MPRHHSVLIFLCCYGLPMSTETMSVEEEARVVEQILQGRDKITSELSKVIIGQHDVIEQLLISLFAEVNAWC